MFNYIYIRTTAFRSKRSLFTTLVMCDIFTHSFLPTPFSSSCCDHKSNLILTNDITSCHLEINTVLTSYLLLDTNTDCITVAGLLLVSFIFVLIAKLC